MFMSSTLLENSLDYFSPPHTSPTTHTTITTISPPTSGLHLVQSVPFIISPSASSPQHPSTPPIPVRCLIVYRTRKHRHVWLSVTRSCGDRLRFHLVDFSSAVPGCILSICQTLYVKGEKNYALLKTPRFLILKSWLSLPSPPHPIHPLVFQMNSFPQAGHRQMPFG